MDSISLEKLLIVFLFVVGFSVVILVSICLYIISRQQSRIKEQDKKIKQISLALDILQKSSSHIEPVEKIIRDKDPYTEKKPIIKLSPEELSLKVDEEQKYTEARSDRPKWWVSEEINMVLPLYSDRTRGIDLRTFPGECKIYVNGKYKYNSNICDMMTAQSLWKALEKFRDVCIEPDEQCQIIIIGNGLKR